jgi:hypothetical protein
MIMRNYVKALAAFVPLAAATITELAGMFPPESFMGRALLPLASVVTVLSVILSPRNAGPKAPKP